ncbi:MAG: acetyl-CoA decarbonylase/synthase complex subunit delta [Deltaproteobacteria bacterium]|nr:MAG: acetyl-CoA decarbonylase/synthase complex subunit delta [Deltaproteobacteria bacterium]
MGFEFYKESYTGGIKEISLGKGSKAVTVGGETCYPFYQFEGNMPNKPKIAMEIWDIEPGDWPESALAHFQDVVSDPAAWAKKCVEEFGADIIVLQLKSIDPNDKDAGPEEAAATVKKVAEAVEVPLIVWGCANPQKDEEVLKKVAEECQGKTLSIGPVEDKNHKGIGAAAMGYDHTIIASSPIDVNLAKQVNILLENLGVSMDRMIIDPTTGGLGYGLEYTYSVMERLRMAALTQGDDKLQLPIINNIGNEVWKCKEAKQPIDEAPILGDPERRGILMEALAAVAYLMSGSDVLILRHPESVRMVRSFIDLALEGGSAAEVAPIKKKLDAVTVDYASIAPEPDLTIEEEEAKKPAPAKKAPPAKEAAPAEAVVPAEKPAAEAAPPEPPKVKAEEAGKVEAKAAEEARIKAEEETKAKAEADARAKAEADAKAQAEVEAKAQAEADAKAKADAAARAAAEVRAKREAEEEEIRQKRAAERSELMAKRQVVAEQRASMTPAAQQMSKTEKMLDRLNRIHRRSS